MTRPWLTPLLALAVLGLSSASALGLQGGSGDGPAGADAAGAQLGRAPAQAQAAARAAASRARRRRIWRPRPRTTWQWQLSGRLDLSPRAQVYDVDLFDTPKRVVSALKRRGRRAVCYTSLGSYESWRPDAGRFPAAVIGKPLDGWEDERWLDVRRLDVLGPIVRRRLDLCRRKGFDGVEPDNVDAYVNDSGFPLRARDQLRFNRFLARAAHARGLSIGLKNDLAQAAALEPAFDWALTEECFEYDECELLLPFVRARKAVFSVEYALPRSRFCARARRLGFMSMRKRLDVDAWRQTCW